MEFTITCPVDGPITVALEDIDTVTLRDSETADITFVCPECGTEITVTAVVPSFLLAAIETLAEDNDVSGGLFAGVVKVIQEPNPAPVGPAVADSTPAVAADTEVAESYCEYFRRQLDHVECVEDALHEIDATL